MTASVNCSVFRSTSPCVQMLESQDLSSFAMLLLDNEMRHAPHHNHIGGGISSPDGSPGAMEYSSMVHGGDKSCSQRSGGGGFKDFFRKRHKSNSSGNGSIQVRTDISCERETGSKGSSSPTSGPGTKMRLIGGGSSAVSSTPVDHRQRSKSDATTPESLGISMPMSVYAYKDEKETMDEISSRRGSNGSEAGGSRHVISTPCSMPVRNIYYQSDIGSAGASGYSRSLFPNFRRSLSLKDSPIGPTEFLEMYRTRTYSESRPRMERAKAARHRRVSFSCSPPDSGSYVGASAYEPHQVIIWRDQVTGTQVFRLPKTAKEDRVEIDTINEIDSLTYLRFLKLHTCYDVIPTSTKLVVFDTELNIKKAFYALVYNSIRAAPLWDTHRQDFVGILTITDFIKVLVKHHKAQNLQMEDIESDRIDDWIGTPVGQRPKPLVYIEPDASMLEAVRKLCMHKVHRLPVIDAQTGNVLYILTYKKLLRYVFLFFQYYNLPQPAFMDRSIEDLNVGTYKNIAMVEPDTLLIVALELFLSRRISSLPVVDKDRRLLGVYQKFDVMNLAAEKTYSNVNVSTVEHVMNNRQLQGLETVGKCLKSESLGTIVARIVKIEAHRLIIVDADNRVEGILSLSDILRFLVITPPVDENDDASSTVRMIGGGCN